MGPVQYDRLIVSLPTATRQGGVVRPVPQGQRVEVDELRSFNAIVVPKPAFIDIDPCSLSWAGFGDFWPTAGDGVKG